ncbi:hypothetical protein RJ55_06975 [Drechmeria coniospora]|nr:hypothetical protein RJ55_06975 [Drechmeria coniospora]
MMRVMPIIRSRTGCFTCRRRKKKCSEEKPICSGCRRNKLDCRWPAETSPTSQHLRTKPWSSADTKLSSDRSSSIAPPTSSESQPPPPPPQVDHSHPDSSPVGSRHREAEPSPILYHSPTGAGPDLEADDEEASMDPDRPPSSSSSHSTASSLRTQQRQLPVHAVDGADRLTLVRQGAFPDDVVHPTIAAPMTLLPSHSPHSYDLLRYYLSRTANSMGNGSTDVNPFVAKLIPLAFSSPLVLQLILAQSAAHRQASKEPGPSNEIAQRYYTDSLGMFRSVVGEHVSGKDDNTLTLTVGSLILCLTEVARGDICGTIFDHLAASRSLLTTLLSRHRSDLSDDLAGFLVEYYMHTAASSMLSIDPRSNQSSLPSPNIEASARALVDGHYMGQLCGCWLELLILIPQVFHLGQRMTANAADQTNFPSADDIMTFGFLQSQILAFFPSPMAATHSQLAGLVFKQGALLYLWSILGTPHQAGANSSHRTLMEGAIAEVVAALSQIPATARVNTSLCWPLAVVGCCTADPAVRDVVKGRIQTMIDSIGLGNIRETLALLENVWRQPLEQVSPWTLHQAMQDHQIWISLA